MSSRMRKELVGLVRVARRDLFPNHSRIKPERQKTFGKAKSSLKRSSFKRKRITDDSELEYLNWLQTQDAECMVCKAPAQHFHHVKEYSTDKKDHTSLIPLCQFHHVGETLSPHGTPKLWRNTYSMKYQRMVALKWYLKFKEVKDDCLE